MPRKNCVVCENKINRSRSATKRRRGKFAINCSGQCSKIYQRIRTYIINPYLRRIKKLNEKKKTNR